MSIEKKDIKQLNKKINDINKEVKQLNRQLDVIKKLLRQSIAIQLYKSGATQDEIHENLKIAAGTVSQMVRGIKKEG